MLIKSAKEIQKKLFLKTVMVFTASDDSEKPKEKFDFYDRTNYKDRPYFL